MIDIVELTEIGFLSSGGHSVTYHAHPESKLVNLSGRRVEYWPGMGLGVWNGPNSCTIYRETIDEVNRRCLAAQPAPAGTS